MGYPERGPYDAIHVGAAAKEAPQSVSQALKTCDYSCISIIIMSINLQLIDQLALGGRLIVPIGSENFDQTLVQIDKTHDGKIKQRSLINVVYVPLTDKERQYSRS